MLTEEIPRWVKHAKRDIKQLTEFANSYSAIFAVSNNYIQFAIRSQLISASKKIETEARNSGIYEVAKKIELRNGDRINEGVRYRD